MLYPQNGDDHRLCDVTSSYVYSASAKNTQRSETPTKKNNEKRLCILYYTIQYIYVHSNADSQLSRNQRKCLESVLRAKQSLWWEGSREMFHLQRRCQSSLQTGLIKMSTRSTWERQRIILFCCESINTILAYSVLISHFQAAC